MRVLVTGAAGFVGRHLIPRLEAEGHRVDATDRELDVSDAEAVAARVATDEPDAIVHLAAQSSDAASWRDPLLTYRVNYLGARSVLEAAAARGGTRVLLVGSGAQYGAGAPGSAPVDEAAPLRPHSPYTRTKSAADLLGAQHAARGADVVRVRAFTHTGPGQTDTFVLPSFARQAAEIAAGRREPVVRVGNLDSVRDFLDVEDVVEAYVRLLDRGVAPDAYNVARGEGVRIGDALDRLLELAGVRAEIRVDEARLRPADHVVGDASRLRAATGWAPRIAFERMLVRLLDYWRGRVSGV